MTPNIHLASKRVRAIGRHLVLVALICFVAACASAPQHISSPALARVVTPLDQGWRFHDGPAPIDAALPSFDDSGWGSVNLPHSWNALGEYALHRSDKTRDRQGEGWYRLVLDGRALPPLSRHFLQFDGVGNVADVWVNGAHVARHAGAFSRFRVDITRELRRSSRNVIAVRADNSRPAPGSSTQDVIPLQGDFFIHGGLYRPVSLVSVGDAHIDLLDHGGPGVYVRTKAIEGATATIVVATRLDRARRSGLELRTTVVDGNGSAVATSAAQAASDLVEQEIVIPNPHLWDGRKDPHLYSVSVELIDGDRIVDQVRQQFGIRSFRFDPDKGFFLNGRHLALHGVSRHQDYLGRGWALDHADHQRDMAIIEELGANTIRMAHYQHAEDWFDLADSAGMIAWAEIPFVNKLSFGNMPATPALIANAREQLVELIRQNYNHPSVVTWSIGNETNIDVASGRLGPRAEPQPLLDQLRSVAHAEDPGRPTVLADCCEDTPNVRIADLPAIAGHSELIGYNRYFGWYYGKTADLGPHLDRLHAKHPAIPISVSEYGAGAALSQHSDNPEGGPINAGGRPHPEEFQDWFHEQSWPQLRSRPYLFATWIWNMFDFSSAVRKEGDGIDINDKGLVTFDRKVRKDAFYYYQAQWRDDVPVLHIVGRRYADRAYPVVDVRIYSNLDRVSVYLNGQPVGTAECADRVCILRQLHLKPGLNLVEAKGVLGTAPVSDRVEWRAPDAEQGLAIKTGNLSGFRQADGRLVGSDNWFDGGIAKGVSASEAESISGDGDPSFRSSVRTGAFSYSIPLPSRCWRVTLYFLALKGSVQAPFDVKGQGRTVLRVSPLPLDRVIARSVDLDVHADMLNLSFAPSASLAGIDVRPTSPTLVHQKTRCTVSDALPGDSG